MFKFMQKKNDIIQEDMNMAVTNGIPEIKDQIDALITDMAYSAVSEIMENNELSDNDEDIHDELFCEFVDSMYSELGIY